jgi:hypothetical protein
MAARHAFEWDVLVHPTLVDWFDALREVGWYRDPGVPGVKTPTGTVIYEFHYLADEDEISA